MVCSLHDNPCKSYRILHMSDNGNTCALKINTVHDRSIHLNFPTKVESGPRPSVEHWIVFQADNRGLDCIEGRPSPPQLVEALTRSTFDAQQSMLPSAHRPH